MDVCVGTHGYNSTKRETQYRIHEAKHHDNNELVNNFNNSIYIDENEYIVAKDDNVTLDNYGEV